ncbi:MAG: hypothetical protein NC417_12930 [Candidatus Gastranaerophilales bacterium]|nr:hypothetical protein [Candidatus Gastranaerophilales bacterium]
METVYKSGSVDSVVDETAAKLKNCAFIMYCADDKRFGEISVKLHEKLPGVQMIGTTGFMFHEKGSFAEGISAVGFLDSEVEVHTGVLRHVDTCPMKYLLDLSAAVGKIKQKYKNNICFECSTGYEEKVVSTMKICLEEAGIRLIGGTAGNTEPDGPKHVACNGEVLTDSTVYAVIGSKMGAIEIFKENLYRARETTHAVTKVSADKRTIYEIDGRKAMDVYEEELGYNKSTVGDGVFKNPLSRIVGADSYITAIFSFNADRSISTYKNILENDVIAFTDIAADYQGFIADNMKTLTNSRNVAGILSVNCILRYLLFDKNHYTGDYAAMMNSMGKGCHWGVVGDGEQYIEQHINQSMVCVIFTKDR